jgi:competence protein ComGC
VFNSKLKINNFGFGLVESIVVIAILSVFVFLIIDLNIFYTESLVKSRNSATASFLIEEGIEAAKFMRDDSWTSNIEALTPDISYFLAFDSSSKWSATTTPQTSDGMFVRTIKFSDVSRDSNGNIVSSGGTVDPGTRLVEIKIVWNDKYGESTKSSKTYITNIFDN